MDVEVIYLQTILFDKRSVMLAHIAAGRKFLENYFLQLYRLVEKFHLLLSCKLAELFDMALRYHQQMPRHKPRIRALCYFLPLLLPIYIFLKGSFL